MTKKHKFKVLDHVWWNDPDNGECSCPGVIRRINGKEARLVTDAGGECGALVSELELLTKFEVDITHTQADTYLVYARTKDEAKGLAEERFQAQDEPDVTIDVGDHEITSCEECS